MSWPASEAVQIELPGRLLSERLGASLCIACGVFGEVVIARYPDLPAGPGILAAALLLAAGHLARRRIRALLFRGPGSCEALLADGRRTECRLGRGTRLLGPTILLDLERHGRRETIWLTPLDIGPGSRRRLGLYLRRLFATLERPGRAA
ncbi:MAG TPA: hypothetical protein VLM41_00455 [Steroidobacteraceae bacterium]|nr:hypothetical protein [Steroidobacteraceae bacterium]